MTLIFVDTETTGLDPAKGHRPWEIALIIRGHRDPSNDGEWVFQHRADLSKADPMALQIGGYYPRSLPDMPYHDLVVVDAPASGYTYPYEGEHQPKKAGFPHSALAELLDGATLVASAPAFDASMLKALLEDHGHYATWSHRLLDVRAMTIGLLLGTVATESEVLSLSSDALCKRVGAWPAEGEDRHTALGDARWVERWYDAIVEYPNRPVPVERQS